MHHKFSVGGQDHTAHADVIAHDTGGNTHSQIVIPPTNYKLHVYVHHVYVAVPSNQTFEFLSLS